VTPSKNSATIGTMSLYSGCGSRRFGMPMLDSRNTGTKTIRSSDSNTSMPRLDFLGYMFVHIQSVIDQLSNCVKIKDRI